MVADYSNDYKSPVFLNSNSPRPVPATRLLPKLIALVVDSSDLFCDVSSDFISDANNVDSDVAQRFSAF